MGDYTIVRLPEVENQAANLGLDENLFEVRMARSDLACESCGVTYERLHPGWRSPFGHRHKQQEEVFVVLSGRVQMKLDDDVVDLEPLTAVRIPPGTMRSHRNPGNEVAEMLVVGAPNTGPGDAEIVMGWWDETPTAA